MHYQWLRPNKKYVWFSDGGENHTCSRLQKMSIALVCCMLFILSYSSEIDIFIHKKTEADSESDGGENHTCSRLPKIPIALVRCMLFILRCSSEIDIFLYIFLYSEVNYTQYVLLQIHAAYHGWQFDS